MSDFADKLAGVCGREIQAARRDPERAADMVERLTHSLAFTIAIIAGSDPDKMQTLITGVEAHLYEVASGSADIVRSIPAPTERPE